VTDAVRVWIVRVDVSPAQEAAFAEMLDGDQHARAVAFAHARDRHRFTVAHGALRILAGRELCVPPAALRWAMGRYGKPALTAPWSGLQTSLSHSGDLAAVAVSTARPVGVDVQHLVRGLDTVGMSARFFPPDEAGHVAAGRDAGARADRFARLWARKEAVVKAAGGRLWPNLRIEVHGRDLVECADPAGLYRVTDIAAPAGYRAAGALAGDAPFVVELADWPPADWPTAGSSPLSDECAL
jgi:4'-phosphopantetheinyl transferase